MKKLVSVILALTLVFALCITASADDKVIKVGASSTPHAEVLEFVKDALAKDGWTLDIVVYDE